MPLLLRHATPWPAARRTLATLATAPPPPPPPAIRSIRPSAQEKRTNTLSQRNMQSALEALHHDGIVEVQDVVPLDAIDKLNARMCRDTRTLIARGTDGPFNYNLGNLQQSPPYERDTFSTDVFFHPLATSVTKAFLGGTPTVSFVSSNAAVKADEGQPVHCDADFDHPKIPFAAVVNVGLVDMHPTNGSTQVWLGTHRDTTMQRDQEGLHGERASGRIRAERLEARRAVSPPLQPTISKGSLIIRDLRLWHAGMPNRTEDIRIMLAMIHFAPWYRQRMQLAMPNEVRDVLERVQRSGDIHVPATFANLPTDHHLDAPFGNAFDFDQDA